MVESELRRLAGRRGVRAFECTSACVVHDEPEVGHFVASSSDFRSAHVSPSVIHFGAGSPFSQ